MNIGRSQYLGKKSILVIIVAANVEVETTGFTSTKTSMLRRIVRAQELFHIAHHATEVTVHSNAIWMVN